MPKNYVLIHRVNKLTNPTIEAGSAIFSFTGKSATLSATSNTVNSNAGDVVALEAMYNDLDGPNWTNNTGWASSGMSLSDSIYGVQTETIGGELRVRSVKLNGTTGWETEYVIGQDGVIGGNNLTGTLPTEIGNLKECLYFNVKQNNLSGSIPSEIGSMTNLEYLHLNGRLFDAHSSRDDYVPGKTYGNYPDIRSNNFTGSLPTELGNLSNIIQIDLIGQNDGVAGITGQLIPELGNLSTLEGLHLAYNDMDGGIPTEFSGLSSLVMLNLGYNAFTGTISSDINLLSNLKIFRISNNQFSGSFPDLSASTDNLRKLIIRQNNFTGNIDWIETANWTNDPLTIMVDFCDFSGDLPDFTGFLGLTTSNWGGNDLGGDMPSSIQDFYRVILLNFGFSPNITGELPQTGWSNFNGDFDNPSGFTNSLRQLRLNHTAMTGNIPAGLFNTADNSDLNALYFNNSDFTGCDIVAASNMSFGEIELASNRLTPKDLCLDNGTIPSNVTTYGSQGNFDSSETISAGTVIDFSEYDHPNNSYQWYRDGNAISGEMSLTYDTTGESSGAVITMQIDHPSFTQTFESNDKTIA